MVRQQMTSLYRKPDDVLGAALRVCLCGRLSRDQLRPRSVFLSVVVSNDALDFGGPILLVHEMLAGMNAAGDDILNVSGGRFVTVSPFVPTAIAGQMLHPILQKAETAFYHLGARCVGVLEFKAKFSEAGFRLSEVDL
jgi:hypothetical protein